MVYRRSSLRYAHTTGHTGLVYTENGEYIITCGSDGDIRKWRGIDDDDPSSHCLGEFVVCIAHTGDKLLASTDRNTVQAYTFPDMDNDGTLLRFTAQVTCMRTRESILVAGSEDTMIKVLHTNAADDARQALQLEGHTGPVLGLDVAPSKGLLASIAGDGQLKIWQLDTGAELKCITGLKRTNSFESAVYYGTPSFEPQQQQLLAYVDGKQVHVLSTDNWEPLYTLSDERFQGDYTCCQFSTDGRLLAAGTDGGEISVFDVASKRALKCESPASDCQAITCLTWQRDSNTELAYCDANGQLGTLFTSTGENGAQLLDDAAEEVDYGDIQFDGAAEVDDFDNADDDDDDGVSIERLKSKVMQAYGVNGDDGENTRDTVATETAAAIVGSGSGVDAPKAFKMQTVFQPGSTPAHLEHRYLVWNDVGIVCAHADSADGAIDVEFHDASVHHALHIANYNNHTMASLSSSVLALSASGAGKLVCIALAASGNKEWTAQLPDCETVEALAATATLVGVVTSMHFLRLYSVLGTQREVLSVPGPVVAMAGHAQDLLVCYHNAPSSTEQQHLAAMLVQTRGLQLRVQQISLPLPPGRQLTWLGFSDAGSPLVYDSMGLLQLYSARNGCWHPICDTLKQSQSVSNNFYVVAASERSQIVQAVLCRGSSYPMTNPRPMLQELPMQLPLCDTDAQQSQLEDQLVRAAIMPDADGADRTIKETAIKLFALACRSELEARAKELVELIACPELLQLAVKYATKLGRIHLADRLSELLPQLMEQEQPFTTAFIPFTPTVSVSSSPATAKLAPKAMELSHAKRASFKRYSASASTHTPNSFKKTSTTSHEESSSKSAPFDTQENIFEPSDNSATESHNKKQSQLTSTAGSVIKATNESTIETRSPLNAVNPFASKRKISDVDFLMGGATLSNRLKMPKK